MLDLTSVETLCFLTTGPINNTGAVSLVSSGQGMHFLFGCTLGEPLHIYTVQHV